jgi:hypothetical protein
MTQVNQLVVHVIYVLKSEFFLWVRAAAGYGTYPASYPMSTGGSFSGGKTAGA